MWERSFVNNQKFPIQKISTNWFQNHVQDFFFPSSLIYFLLIRASMKRKNKSRDYCLAAKDFKATSFFPFRRAEKLIDIAFEERNAHRTKVSKTVVFWPPCGHAKVYLDFVQCIEHHIEYALRGPVSGIQVKDTSDPKKVFQTRIAPYHAVPFFFRFAIGCHFWKSNHGIWKRSDSNGIKNTFTLFKQKYFAINLFLIAWNELMMKNPIFFFKKKQIFQIEKFADAYHESKITNK